MSHYPPDARVAVAPFTRHHEGGEVVIGKPQAAVFLALPPAAVDLLDYLAKGGTVGEARDFYKSQHGEEPDLEDFLGTLEREGFVWPLRHEGASGPREEAPGLRYHFTSIPESLAKRLFGRPMLALYGGTIALATALVLARPALLPGWRSLFFTQNIVLTYATLMVMGYSGIFLHEMAHLLAARALGIPSRLGIGNRLWMLVAETDMTGLWGVPPHRRYLPFLAGPLMDAFSAAVLVLVSFAQEAGWFSLPPFLYALLRARLMGYLLGLLWQCYFFVRTDFYYVIATWLGCKNLMGDTTTFVRNQAARVLPWFRHEDQSHLPAHELRAIRGYAFVWVGGRVLALGVLFTVSLPLLWNYLLLLFSPASQGASEGARMDLIWTLPLRYVPLLLGLWLWLRSFRKPKEA